MIERIFGIFLLVASLCEAAITAINAQTLPAEAANEVLFCGILSVIAFVFGILIIFAPLLRLRRNVL